MPSRAIDERAVRLAVDRAAEFSARCEPTARAYGEGKVRVRYELSGDVQSVEILTTHFFGKTPETARVARKL